MMRKILVSCFLMLALTACSHNPDDKVKVMNMALAPPPPAEAKMADADVNDDPDNSHPSLDTSKKLIKVGEIDFETASIKDTRKRILHSLTGLGGYLAKEDETNNSSDNQNTLELTLRVPTKNFDLLLDSISSDAEKVDSKTMSVKDVTAQYIDIKTALYNKRLLETRYQDLLKKADKIGDVLQIENKLTDIRTAIDSTQGQLNYLNREIAFSTLTVSFYTRKLPQDVGYSVGYKFLASISDGWALLENAFFGLIGIWPALLVFVILFLWIKRWRKRRRARKLQA